VALSLGELADRLGAELVGDPAGSIERVATLERAGPGAVSFFSNRRYRKQLSGTRASAVILAREYLSSCPVDALVTDNPYLGYARAAAILNPEPEPQPGVHPRAWVSERARVDPGAWVGPNAVVEAQAEIGAGVFVGPCCVVGERARVGAGSRLYASVTLRHDVRVGERARLHPGVVIGADGFGIANDGGAWVKVPQLGSVRIGDDVEIGANSTVDRGALEDTVIEDGVKLDNQVQIAHNVHIGANTAVAGCVGIAGSAKIGRRCTIGGASAINGHIEIADDVHLTGATHVHNSIEKPGVYSSGMLLQDNRSWRRTLARLRKLDDMARRLRALEAAREQRK